MVKEKSSAMRVLLVAFCSIIFMFGMLMMPMSLLAATWQWQERGNNERIIIDLDADQTNIQAKRNNLHSVVLPINIPNLTAKEALPDNAKLAAAINASAEGVVLQMQNSAFGYLVSQPSSKQIIIDIFSDPLGARWQPDGNLAPVGTAGKKLENIQNVNLTAPDLSAPAATTVNQQENTIIPPASPSPEVNSEENTNDGVFSMPPEQGSNFVDTSNDESALPLQDANGSLGNEQNSAPSVEPPALPQEQAPNIVENKPTSAVEMEVPGHGNVNMELNSILVAAADPAEINAKNTTVANAEPSTPEQLSENTAQSTANTLRGRALGAQEVVGKINTQGPDAWPEDAGINTTLPVGPSLQQGIVTIPEGKQDAAKIPPDTGQVLPQSSVTPPSDTDSNTAITQGVVQPVQSQPNQATNLQTQPTEIQTTTTTAPPIDDTAIRQSVDTEGKPVVEEEVVEPRPVIYMDEEGNIIEKPIEPEELFAEIQSLLDESKYTEAIPKMEQLKAMPNVTKEMREQVLYDLSDALFAVYEGKPIEGFEPIVSATSEAMNANLRSTRVPDALYRLGVAHLGVGNFAEAEGYFKALKRRYPYDINIPTAFYQLGNEQLKKGLYAEAEKNFRLVLQEFPDASALDEATIGLVKALTKLKDYNEAQVFADFADKRWARLYVEDPDYINYLAEIDYNLGNKQGALDRYWLLYNLDPQNERAADTMAKIGDLYFETGRSDAALEVFADIEARFPKTDAAALAYLRRAEKGIYDSPINLAEMFAIFENPGSPLPQVAYKTLEKTRPTDPRSITGELKYAMWELWNREYTDAMGSAADFIDLYPENADVELAKDVIMRGFMADLKNSLAEENYGRVLILWNGFPVVRERYGPIDADLRNALGRGYIERGEDEKAMEMLAEFLKTPMNPRYSEATFALYFNKYLESGNWNAMLDLGELVKDWSMSPSMRGQLDYAMALSAENLGLRERALALWKPLIDNENLQLYQRAYATYFLAKDAEERQDIKDAYSYNLKTLELFEKLRQERSDRADSDRIKEAIGSLMDITEVSNRIPEALEWVEKYSEFAPEGSPEYPGLRFREARLYRKLGNDERARLLLEIIVNDYADSPFASAASTELSTFEMSRDLQNFLPGGGGGGTGGGQDS